ncbi:MAG TPA: Fe-S cluster assembly protein SufD [Nitrososphaeraceae archaeon]|nr:Fe-S cluster assembly protein SufD [Nitrososphaeraceae archaeon]
MYTLSSIGDNFDNIFDDSEPQWMREFRKDASLNYEKLPFEVSQLYTKYSNANRLLPDKIFFDETKENQDVSIFSDRIAELSKGNGIVCKNGGIVNTFLNDDLKKRGLVISKISEALNEYSDIIQKHLTKNKLDFKEDRFLALCSAAFKHGFFIYVPKNMVIDEPIRIINYLSERGSSSISRNIIISESNSKATVVQELYSANIKNKEIQQVYFELMDAHLMNNSQLEMVTLQSLDYQAVNFSNRKSFVEQDANMSWSIGLFGSQLSRYKIDSIMQGQGASVGDVEIIFGIDNQSFDISSNLIHSAPNTKGRVLVKSVMKDTSQSLFKGMIKINKNAKSTESYLAGHAILLDKGAKSDAIPGLEIESNEVKATHSASVSQIDEKQIFYLMSRGLSEESAKREIVGGFLEPISRRMGPTIRAWINYLIENKWLGKPLILRTDEAMEQILEVEKTRYRETEDIFEKHYKYR